MADLAAETQAAADEIGRPGRTVESLAKAVERLSGFVGLSKGRKGRDVEQDEQTKPDASEFEDETEEGEMSSANKEVEASRFERGEPRDSEDARAERANGKRQERLTSKSRKDEDEDEEDERKSRSRKSRREEDEDEEDERKSRKSRREDEDEEDERKSRKSRREEDEDEGERKSRKSKSRDGDWDDDSDALHGKFEDPAEGEAEGSEDADDDTIITNQNRRIRGSGKAQEKSLREVFYRDLGKSGAAVRAIEASDVLNHLATVTGDSLGRLNKSLGDNADDVRSLRRIVKSQGEVLVNLAGVVTELHKALTSAPVNMPMPGVALTNPAVAKGKTDGLTIGQVRKAMTRGVQLGVTDSSLAANFDSASANFENPTQLANWVRTYLTDEQRAALGLV